MNAQRTHTAAFSVDTAVRQVATALEKTYAGLLELGDIEGLPEHEYRPRMLSRALTAQAVRIATGFSPAEAAATVIDGHADQGIDAIAVVDGPKPHVYLVQGKWSPTGKASGDRNAVNELFNGLELIDNEDFAPFNPRGRQWAEIAKTVMDKGPVPVTQLIVLMRRDEPGTGFYDALEAGKKRFNSYSNRVGHRIILAREVWDSVLADLAPEPVELTATLFPWFGTTSTFPHESYQGIVMAEQIAEWAESGSNLFNLNIRNPLGRTAINNALIETLKEDPALFWYFNNGITVLCDSVEKTERRIKVPQQAPLTLTLYNASVVNGAQTVRAVAEAVAADEMAGTAQVGVRIIVTGRATDFAKETTKATNRQNRVEARDFIALDPVQAVIMEEMRAELGLEYGVRRSEVEPSGDIGCSVVEATCALACFHRDAQYAARIAPTLNVLGDRDSEVLWERGPQGIYDVLFRPRPGVYLLWNTVLVLREVRRALNTLRAAYESRGAALTEHGLYLLAHLVFRRLDTEAIDEPDPELEWARDAVKQIPDLLGELIPTVAATIDTICGERSQIRLVCADANRCREIVEHVLHAAEQPGVLPKTDKYRRAPARRKPRRPNAVRVLVDKGVLDEGTPLTVTPGSSKEAEALREWLAEDERRGRATWVNHRTKPILWAVDGKRYAPSGLITRMWEEADWKERPVSNQGSARWMTADGETLADLAWRTLQGLEDPDGEGSGSAGTSD
ncbi:hypothetical protein GCM10027160_09680 [Streptomyces calidiresistens]|uniref:Abortive phage infection protein n=1 Tax=Streptomyces calidiresistens TaxID=1485586 RepID=A0A7W3XYF7_9ACTN|nr:AIPR family protein [Streptomyces calidiresistens]MBB0231908.1 abortive phage infection protein [Streptomyces calidiresistens]